MGLIDHALHRALDSSVLFSFDRSGYLRHAARFRADDLEVELEGRVCLVTGANSGIGLATAEGLSRLGATVWLLCRSRERGERAARRLRALGGGPVELALVDVASRRSVADFVRGFDASRVDVLVNNAGVLPERRLETPEGLELTWATNVVGPHLLTRLLRPRLEAAEQGRVINVSSGGMYTQRLDLADPQWRRRRFDGVRAYALSKRAEVVLTERWARELAGTRVTVNSMHPGWVDTPAVRASLPRFHRVMRGRLRTPAQGADTAVWLAACPRLAGESGRFWFDREARPTELLPGTRAGARARARLWELCQQQTFEGGQDVW